MVTPNGVKMKRETIIMIEFLEEKDVHQQC